VTLADIQAIRADLRCPTCHEPLQGEVAALSCAGCGRNFSSVSHGEKVWPILIDGPTSVVDTESLRKSGGASLVPRRGDALPVRILRRLLSPYNHVAEEFVARLVSDAVASGVARPKILMIGGGAVGNGIAELYADSRIDLYAFDIYATPAVQLIADAHELPWPENFFDGVIVQAVLEHVLEPERVVAEIHRILVPDGLVYADTPFMQQVHEGPYDFTRFTESGHRWLFRRFTSVSSGVVAGAGTSLLWSIDYFVRGLTGRKVAGKAARLLFCWLPLFDKRMKPNTAVEGANSVYFYGRKSAKTLQPADAIAHYLDKWGG
jgi:SAM-dependent methyltransferase